MPVKSVGGRASSSQVNWSAPLPPASSLSLPPRPRYHDRAEVFGAGNELKDFSNPGPGAPGALAAPLSNRIRTGRNDSKAALADAKSGSAWIGSSGSVTPGTPSTDE